MKIVWMLGLTVSLIATGKIEVIRMEKSPYNERAIIKQMRLEGDYLVLQTIDFPLGMAVQKSDANRGMRESAHGSTILVWIYGPSRFQRRVTIVAQDGAPFAEEYTYFKKTIRKKLAPGDLPPSKNAMILAFCANSLGETIKMRNAQKILKVGDDAKLKEGLSKPFLVYNMPYGNYSAQDPYIMLDFYMYNADIGSDAYTVEVYIDGKLEETLKTWSPYKLRGMTPGKHEIQLILLDPKGKRVEEPFGEQKDTIYIESK